VEEHAQRGRDKNERGKEKFQEERVKKQPKEDIG